MQFERVCKFKFKILNCDTNRNYSHNAQSFWSQFNHIMIAITITLINRGITTTVKIKNKTLFKSIKKY